MYKKWTRIWSVLLVITMVINLLPIHAIAVDTEDSTVVEQELQEHISADDVFVVGEVVDRRTEYTKVFQLSNGLYVGSVYASPVHYEVNGQWAEIDNTLQLSQTRSGDTYINTAGVWQVSFPKNMTDDHGISITKDGYTFSFRMSGELHDAPSLDNHLDESEIIEIPAVPSEPVETDSVIASNETYPVEITEEDPTETDASQAEEIPTESFPAEANADENLTDAETGNVIPAETEPADGTVSVGSIATAEGIMDTRVLRAPEREVAASIQAIDMEEMKATTEYPETIAEKIHSRLSYDGIYESTDVIFDLDSNRVKESVVLKTYRDTLRGYAYILDVGDLTPVLLESGEIELRDALGEELIMYMPAPYLIDDAGITCFDVNVSLEGDDGKYVLSYELPQEWLADPNRQWPVILDPAVQADMDIVNIRDAAVYSKGSSSYKDAYLIVGYRPDFGLGRTYIKYQELPKLTSADVIVSASLTLCKRENSSTVTSAVEVHGVTKDWASETITWTNKPDPNPTVEDFVICKTADYYCWDVTEIARSWYDDANYGLMLKYPDSVEPDPDEPDPAEIWELFHSSDEGTMAHRPNLIIIFRNNNGLENHWDYTTSSAGRAGTGYVHQYTGNLVWTHNDIGFGGNRMPVSISHIYNANDSAKNEFGLGNGWRTNFNQRVYHWDEGSAYGDYYVWEDADGTDHYFLYESANTYKDEDGLELTLTTNGSGTEKYCIKDKQGNASYFDTYGRLTKQSDNQATKSNITIAYTTTSGPLISSITDGIGRVYQFAYNSYNLLTSISCNGKTGDSLGNVQYTYDTAPNLRKITHQDGEETCYEYEVRIYQVDSTSVISNLLSTVTDIDGYTLTCNYHATSNYYEPARVSTVKETDGGAVGGQLAFEYGQNQTTITDRRGNVQIVQFNNWGNTTGVYDDQGRAQFAHYATDDPPEATESTGATSTTNASSSAKGNQLLASSKLQNTVSNLLEDSSFESSTNWLVNSSSVSCSVSSEAAYLGSKSLKLVRPTAGAQAGVYRDGFSVSAGETYTFSAYVKTGSAQAYLVIWDGSKQIRSDIALPNSDWTRLEVTYTATGSATIYPHLLTPDAGTIYMDCVQMEKTAAASRYNLIQNGDLRNSSFWSSADGRVSGNPAAPQLDATVYQIAGSPTAVKRVYQTLNISGNEGDTYVFGGWAKANSVPLDTLDTNPREFAIIATFTYSDGTTGSQKARFNPHVNNWQYAATFIKAEEAYTSLKIELAYDYNANTAFFDGIQLFKDEFGNHYQYDTDGNVDLFIDSNGQPTKYTYYDNGIDLQKIEVFDESYLTDDSVTAKLTTTYTYDDYHNVLTSTSSTGVSYSYAYDAYGNNTSVTITGGGVTQTSGSTYSSDGNCLASTTNAAGQTTYYEYDADTNVLKSVRYPADTDTTKTQYGYDGLYRLENVAVTTSENKQLSAQYTYSDDNLSKLETASTTYNFTYDEPFSQISKISIGSFTLAQYQYSGTTEATTNSLPGPVLSRLDYGNEDHVQYTYDKQGRITAQTYEDGDTVTYRYDNDGELASVTDSATGLSTKYTYDLIGRTAAIERRNNGSIILRTEQSYNSDGQLTKRVTEFSGGARYTNSYTYNPDLTPQGMVSGVVGTGFVYDALKRVSQVNSEIGVLVHKYTYCSQPHTNQVVKLDYPNLKTGYSFNYTYDGMGNIATYQLDCVNDGYDEATFTYTYDSQNQLLGATDGTVTYSYEYDNAGNIVTANGHTYTYGNAAWGDLLTAYDGQSISYDGIGNPTSYYNGTRWNFTWKHGRQLATATNGTDSISYTYDTDGLRTSKTVNGVVYSYYYVGSQLTRMTYGDNVLDFFYDINGIPIAMRHGYVSSRNYVVYYYITNLQGDVIRVVDRNGNTAAYYEYDPYGNAIKATGSYATINPLRYRGYVYDTESGLYYLQSRYYDPKIGRFINADAFVSTGQGILGNNMFAYCLNDPVSYYDPMGNCACTLTGGINDKFEYTTMCSCGGGGTGGGGTLLLTGLIDVADSVATSVVFAVSYAYRQYARGIKLSANGMLPGTYPVIHHIMPYGNFSSRDPYVQQQLAQAQEIMRQAGVDPKRDPVNQIAISASYHLSLHTNDYILMVTTPIIALGNNPTKEQIYEVLFYLRISIAANDPYAYGY